MQVLAGALAQCVSRYCHQPIHHPQIHKSMFCFFAQFLISWFIICTKLAQGHTWGPQKSQVSFASCGALRWVLGALLHDVAKLYFLSSVSVCISFLTSLIHCFQPESLLIFWYLNSWGIQTTKIGALPI